MPTLQEIAQQKYDELYGDAQTVRGPNGEVVAIQDPATDQWLRIPYGVDPYEYLTANADQRILMQQLGGELETRDTNRDVVAGAYTQTATQQQGVHEALTQAEAQRLQYEHELSSQYRDADAALYQQAAGATDLANQQGMGVLGALGGLYGESAQEEDAALAGLGYETNATNARAAGFLDDLAGETDLASSRAGESLEFLRDTADPNQLAGQQALSDLRGVNERIDSGEGFGLGDVQYDPFEAIDSEASEAGADAGAIAAQRDALQRYGEGPNALTSAAAGAAADPLDVAAQRNALDSYQLGAGGAYDVTSRAADASPDGEAVDNQNDTADMWRRYAGMTAGSEGDTEQLQQPFADLESREAVAYADPEAVEAQRSALRQMQGLTGGELTAQERLNFETARRGEERDRNAYTNSRLRDMRERGVGGSGAEITAALGGQQITSENRMLADMAALAQAQARQQAMLGMYADTAGTIREQSFGEEARRGEAYDEMAIGNRDTRTGALEQLGALSGQMRDQSFGEQFQAGSAADRVALANADTRLSYLDQYGDNAARMREQGFEEQFRTGMAGDETAALNESNRLAYLDQYGDAAAQMRQQSFGEQFQTGTAEDAIQQFNATQQQTSQQWEQEFNQEADRQAFLRQQQLAGMTLAEADRAWQMQQDLYGAHREFTTDEYGRAADLASASFDQNQLAYARTGDLYDATTGSTARQFERGTQVGDTALQVGDQNYQRSADLVDYGTDLNATSYSRQTDYLDGVRQAQADYYGRTRDAAADTANYTGLYTDQGQAAQAGISNAYDGQLAQRTADRAMDQLAEEEDLLSRLSLGVL